MNKFLIPLLLLLGSFLYSWFWNEVRLPECSATEKVVVEQTMDPSAVDTTTLAVEAPTPVLTEEEKVLFEPLEIYFNPGSSTIVQTTEIKAWLAQAKAYLEKNPNEKLSVTGHSDSDGEEAMNETLSLNRAGKVKNILVNDGFAASNLETFGKGEAAPIADNGTAEGKAKNRRVSIQLMK